MSNERDSIYYTVNPTGPHSFIAYKRNRFSKGPVQSELPDIYQCWLVFERKNTSHTFP